MRCRMQTSKGSFFLFNDNRTFMDASRHHGLGIPDISRHFKTFQDRDTFQDISRHFMTLQDRQDMYTIQDTKTFQDISRSNNLFGHSR